MALRFSTRVAWLTRTEQRLYNVDGRELGPQPARVLETMTARSRAVLVRDIWVEDPIGADWVAAYRLTIAPGDRIVIGEVRVFPAAGPREPNTGRWLADILGSDAPVPAGGIKTRTVLRRLRLDAHRRAVGAILNRVGSPWDVTLPATGARRGRKPTPAADSATAAVLYETCWLDGSAHPTRDVARVMKLTPGAARSRIASARRLGLLTPSSRGEIGGHASARARGLDGGRAARLQRIATAGQTRGAKAPQVPIRAHKKARHSTGGNSGR